MPSVNPGVVVGLDNGGTSNNATVLDGFRPASSSTTWSRRRAGCWRARTSPSRRWPRRSTTSWRRPALPRAAVRAVGLDTPGPASADGVISSKGSTNFTQPGWRGFDIRGALEARLGLPVVYNNDGNAAALYAHHRALRRGGRPAVLGGRDRRHRAGRRRGRERPGGQGAAGMAGELGHVQIPMHGLLGRGPAAADVQLRLRRATRRASPR